MDLPESVSPPIPFSEFPDIIDVRSPLEFAEDHLPGAVNLPVLNDEERHRVGELHARDPHAARRMGATLITGNIHHHLATTLSGQPGSFAPLIYCWRGNLRSQSMAVILRAIGWRTRILAGGYKAWRKFLIADLPSLVSPSTPRLIVLGGLTGCGKTRLLHELQSQGAQVLDLEGLANHKGSILGSSPEASQPSQKRFESLLWQAFRKFDPARPVFTEAESSRIGKLQCPPSLWQRLGRSTVIQIDLSLIERAKLLAEDYAHFIEDPEFLKITLDGLRRLRGHQQVDEWHRQIDERDWTTFLHSILTDHYDLCYRRPGSESSVYSLPEDSITIRDFSPGSFRQASETILKSVS